MTVTKHVHLPVELAEPPCEVAEGGGDLCVGRHRPQVMTALEALSSAWRPTSTPKIQPDDWPW